MSFFENLKSFKNRISIPVHFWYILLERPQPQRYRLKAPKPHFPRMAHCELLSLQDNSSKDGTFAGKKGDHALSSDSMCIYTIYSNKQALNIVVKYCFSFSN